MKNKIIVMCMCILSFTLFISVNTQAKTQKLKKWEKSYNKFLKKSNAEAYAKVYMDKSKIPVLITTTPIKNATQTDYINKYNFYKYKKGKIRKIGSHTQQMADIDVYINKRTKKVLFNEYACNSTTFVCEMKKGKIRKKEYYAGFRQDPPIGNVYYQGNKEIDEKLYNKKTKKTGKIQWYANISPGSV